MKHLENTRFDWSHAYLCKLRLCAIIGEWDTQQEVERVWVFYSM